MVQKTDSLRCPSSSATQNGFSRRPIVVGRKQRHRLDVRLARGDITQAEGRAIMLGIFSDVRPGGAAVALDRQMGGVLAEMSERRMFAARLGEVFMLPTSRRGIRAELLVMVGLGAFGQFTTATLRFAIENAIRTLLRCRVDDLVTIPIGGGTGMESAAILRATLDGVLAALQGGSRPTLRGMTICERDPVFCEQLTTDLLTLSATAELDELEITLEREQLPDPLPSPRDSQWRALEPEGDRNYLIVRALPAPPAGRRATRRTDRMEMALLTAGHKATVLTAEQPITDAVLDQLVSDLQRVTQQNDALDAVERLGHAAYELLLPTAIQEALASLRPRNLTVITDLWSSRVPWEIVQGPQWSAGRDGNLSRRYATSNISVAKWLPSRRDDPMLRFLLVANPTEDLDGAEQEGQRIEAMVAAHDQMQLTFVRGAAATRDRLIRELASGEYDVIHYAGHAFFDPDRRSASGIICADHDVLSGRELALLESLPPLAVFNACESARVRAAQLPLRARSRTESPPLTTLIDRNVSFAEGLLRGGIGSYVGTYWPVGDTAAALFADEFYGQLVRQHLDQPVTLGEALRHARHAMYQAGEVDWANYIHYGEPAFRIKT